MAESWLNQASIDRALGLTPEAAPAPELVFDNSFPRSDELRQLLGGDFAIADQRMLTKSMSTGETTVLVAGRWLVANDRFYQVKESGDQNHKQFELVRATVRPQETIAHDSKENFVVNIHDGRAFINRDSVNQDVWLTDEKAQATISKRGKTLVINGNEAKGKHHEIEMGQEKIHLVKTDDGGWELINDAVFAARYPEGKEKAGGADWNVPMGEFFAGAGKEAKILLGTTFKFRGLNDILSLAALGATELGGIWGNTAGGLLMMMNSISLLAREGKTMKQIRSSIKDKIKQAKEISQDDPERKSLITEIFAGTGLTEKEIGKGLQGNGKLSYLAASTYRKQTAFGKVLTAQESVTNLSRKEKNTAFLVGIAGVTALEGAKSLTKILPLSSLTGIFVTRLLMRYVLPNLMVYAGRKAAFGKEGNMSAEALQKAREWTNLSLQVMSTTFTTLITAGYGVSAGVVGWNFAVDQLNQMIINQVQATEATKTPNPTVTPSPTGTAEVPATVTLVPATETPSAMPTETLPPTPEFLWQPGQPVDDALLNQAEAAGHLLDTSQGIKINLFGQDLELFRFDLDQKPDDHVPEVWAVKNEESNWVPVIWEDKVGQFAVDLNGDGLADGWIPKDDLPRELLPGGRGGGGEAPRLDLVIRDLDLNNDGRQDILPQINATNGKEEFFIDRDVNGQISPADEKVNITFTVVPDNFTQIIQTIEFADGSYWEAVIDKETDTVTYRGKTEWGWLADPSTSKTAALQAQYVNEYGQLYSPHQIGTWAVKNPEGLVPPSVPVTIPVVPSPLEETVTETDHGSWHQVGDEQWGVKANGDRVWLTPEEGGIHGVL
ncbi:MAG: hypothetical protein Q8P47_01025, partial [Candidatus Beckwithbacteria bacterium]|nr:hypothetical protein [Candidatus Beckwithbacteria bacterium]